jgi:hypothetical protein
MDLREGFQTTSAQRLGNAADALHSALCQSLAGAPGEKPVIRLFPAWPKEWDARFKLRMRGGFLVSASMRQGQVEFVELSAQQGGECWLRNPWPERGASVRRAGQVPEALNAPLLKLPTTAGERILLLRARSSKLSDSAP